MSFFCASWASNRWSCKSVRIRFIAVFRFSRHAFWLLNGIGLLSSSMIALYASMTRGFVFSEGTSRSSRVTSVALMYASKLASSLSALSSRCSASRTSSAILFFRRSISTFSSLDCSMDSLARRSASNTALSLWTRSRCSSSVSVAKSSPRSSPYL